MFHFEKDKIFFYATAYNTGFWKHIDVIERQGKLKTFPSGHVNEQENYSYDEIATCFFEKLK